MKKISRRTKRNVSLYGLIVAAMLALTGIAGAEPVPIALEDIKATGDVPLQLSVFECGVTRINDMTAFDPNAEKGLQADVPVTCYLIRHPEGTVMVDAGIPDAIAEIEDGIAFMNGAFVWLVPNTLQSQLNEMDIDPATIDYLAISHIHPDHIGNLPYFSEATMLIHEDEYATIPTAIEEMENLGVDPGMYAAVEAHRPVRTFQGNYDVFGDGSVVFIPAPGHSAGHSIIWVDVPETGPVILAGDLYGSHQEHENYVVPGRTLNKRQLVKSFVLVDDLLEQTGAQLWLNHDKKQNETIAHAPAFYE